MVEEAYLIGGDNTINLKKAIARILYTNGIDQLKISEILDLSQPMVSNYCNSNDKIPIEIDVIAKQITNKIINGQKLSFQTCINFSDKKYEGKYYIATKQELISDENSKIFNNLTEAFFILKGKNISNLIPEIKINIAMAKENAENSNDVAAFLNGLIIADDKITGHNGIRFGESKHLSKLLLDLKDKIRINAIMNIAYLKNINNSNFAVGYLSKDYKLKNNHKKFDILQHSGDFGIEPCSYVLGKNAIDVVNKILKIKEEIK
jgi:predicted fused transcriptional regulator/phosphomethylpyrimidine kinase